MIQLQSVEEVTGTVASILPVYISSILPFFLPPIRIWVFVPGTENGSE